MSSKHRIPGAAEGSDMSNDLQLNRCQITHVDWRAAQNTLSNLRRQVFIIEQGVPQEEEWDGQDETAQHWLATDAAGIAIGTARLLPSGQIGRMAVLSDYRGTGIGATLLAAAVNHG
jgi:predicted GNAT family N-acyltransferase